MLAIQLLVIGGILSESIEFFATVARSKPQDKAPRCQPVQRDGRFRDMQRVAQGQHGRRRPDGDPPRSKGKRAQHRERVGMAERLGIPGPVQRHIADPNRIEAQIIGKGGQIDLLAEIDLIALAVADRQHDPDRQMALAEQVPAAVRFCGHDKAFP